MVSIIITTKLVIVSTDRGGCKLKLHFTFKQLELLLKYTQYKNHFMFSALLQALIQGSMKLMTSSMACTTPSPSQRPIEPPTEERKELRVGPIRNVVVTCTCWEKVMSILIWLLLISARNLVSEDTVSQGRRQSDTWVPSYKSMYLGAKQHI